MTIKSIAVLGAGSAGLMAALTLKRKLPDLAVQVIRSPDIGIIGVGEGTTASFPRHFFEYLKLKPQQFYKEADPTWKLGIKFLWGPQEAFYYTFAYEHQHRFPDLSRNTGFFFNPAEPESGKVSAFMAAGKAFPKRPDGMPEFHQHHAYHVENRKLVGWLETLCRQFGVAFKEATVHPETGPQGIEALVTDDGERLTADLYIDASGFRSELLGGALEVPFRSYDDALFCDRAIISGWERTDEPILPYTVAETMESGWCWQIEHEKWINRGYVFSSRFISDEAAREEFLKKNPKTGTDTRVVPFRSGRYERLWEKNVVAIGNSAGFVEPLEATALQVICVEANTLTDSLIDCLCAPNPSLIRLYNDHNTRAWDDIRDFLAIHYKYNHRLKTPFWKACQEDTALHGAEFLVQFYQENGPSVVAGSELLHASNSFGMDGYLALLLGQAVPHDKPHTPSAAEERTWAKYRQAWTREASRGLTVRQCLDAIRSPRMKWA